jgi:hypothetical protein
VPDRAVYIDHGVAAAADDVMVVVLDPGLVRSVPGVDSFGITAGVVS